MDTVTFAFSAAGIAAFFLLLAGYRGLKRKTKNDEIVHSQANRAADAAQKVGGYDELIEIERWRREHHRPEHRNEIR